MLKDAKFWILFVAALALLVLSVSNFVLRREIAGAQDQILQNQAFLKESTRVSSFNDQFIRALAQLAAQTNDRNIKKLLEDNGVTFTVSPTPPSQAGESDE